MLRTFYLWDLADTLFIERWNREKTGLESYDAYLESLGYDLKTVSQHDYEYLHEKPYLEEMIELTLPEGFKEVLTWTKYNGVFTTGNCEQLDWRAPQLKRKYGFDVRALISEVHSTFDYAQTNQKTPEMLMDILSKKYKEGFDTFVYVDDKETNCKFFLEAVGALKKQGLAVSARAYQLLQNKSGVVPITDVFTKIGTLFDFKLAESKIFAS